MEGLKKKRKHCCAILFLYENCFYIRKKLIARSKRPGEELRLRHLPGDEVP